MTTYRTIGLNNSCNRANTLMIDAYIDNTNKYLDQSLKNIEQLKRQNFILIIVFVLSLFCLMLLIVYLYYYFYL